MAPGDLLQWLSLAQKTGTLVVTSGTVEKKIFFKDGRILSSASTDPRSYLGQFLMSHGYINEEQLKKAMEIQAEKHILLGKILVDMGTMTEQDLLRLMRVKAEEEIYDIFLWKEAEFHFLDEEVPKMELVPLHVDVTGIIMEGARRMDEWVRIRQLVPEHDVVPVVEKPIDPAELSEVPRRIYQAINGHRSIEDLMLETRASHFTVSRTIFELVKEGALKLIEPRQGQPLVQSGKIAAMASEEDEISGLLNRAQGLLKEGDFEKCLRLIKAAQNIDPTSAKVATAMKGATAAITASLQKTGVMHSRVPKLVKTFEQIADMNFNPNEGFVLSRINGLWDVGSIIKISPMREIDALLIFHKLKSDGIIELS